MIKRTLALLATVLLAGCASNSDEKVLAELAKARAAAINQQAPYHKIDQYQVMKAHAKESMVEITILYGGGGKIPPTMAAKSAAINYCNNDELSPLVNDGINYNIVIMDMRGRPMVNQPITAQTCNDLTAK
ncbi:hypothetical protein ABT56_02390 [Photobacterium aquae]|uniref:Lipoprotein n=1 Tax=Photobacterium aquae TaxID=1195763 RepID=A0A0J1HBM5_9GAMM|nr:type II secretion system pilot lipoprotein GspS-beta [Photobacterium aquae]KLV09069.1 hypothetical protein ABT56_02390 [Photobacterium aquae]